MEVLLEHSFEAAWASTTQALQLSGMLALARHSHSHGQNHVPKQTSFLYDLSSLRHSASTTKERTTKQDSKKSVNWFFMISWLSYFCVKLFVQQCVSTFRASIREAAGGKAPKRNLIPHLPWSLIVIRRHSVKEISLQETQLSPKQGEGEMSVT